MKRVLLATVALGAMTSMAAAEPKRLVDTEMSQVTAGFIGSGEINVGVGGVTVNPTIGPVTVQTNVAVSTAVANAVGVLSTQVEATAANFDELANMANQGVNSSFPQP
jgi:hypothetical protein